MAGSMTLDLYEAPIQSALRDINVLSRIAESFLVHSLTKRKAMTCIEREIGEYKMVLHSIEIYETARPLALSGLVYNTEALHGSY